MYTWTDLNAGAGNACASHNKLISALFATSKELIFAIFGNFGDTRPAGSNVERKFIISLKIIYLLLDRSFLTDATAVQCFFY